MYKAVWKHNKILSMYLRNKSIQMNKQKDKSQSQNKSQEA